MLPECCSLNVFISPRGGGGVWQGGCGSRGGRLLASVRDSPPPVEVGRRPPGGGGGGRETVATLHVRLDFPVSTSSLRPSNSMICPGNCPKRPPEASNADSHKPRIGHIFGYMAQNAIPRAPTPPATPHFLWFPPLRIAQTDAYTLVPRPTRLRQAASSSPNRWVPKWVIRVQ